MTTLIKIPLFIAIALGTLTSCATRKPAPPTATTTATATPNPVIFRLVSRTQTLTVTSSHSGPLYSVTDNTGRVLLADSTLEQVALRDPKLYRWINSALCANASSAAR
jgi:type IV pilus biogenesis protein CpaD/CtpE